jgi:hypothetical protein
VQRQRQLYPGLQLRRQPALYGAAGPRLCPRPGRRPAARHPLAPAVSGNEPRRARPIAAADAARDPGPAARARRLAARAAARGGVLHRLQHSEDSRTSRSCASTPSIYWASITR